MTGGVVIIGASVAGVRTAQALRTWGYSGGITLVDQESQAPHDKPPLSKQFLAGAWTVDDIALLPSEQARSLGIELLLDRSALGLDTANRSVELDGGTRLSYDVLVVATGARARPSPWSKPDRIFVVRSQSDAEALRQALVPVRRLVVVGAGFIGAEVATTARDRGLSVTVVDPLAAPLGQLLGDPVGTHLACLPGRYGVEARFGVSAEDVLADGDEVSVILSDGERLRADVVVVGIGAIPNDDWLTSSSLVVEDGVVCDEFGRAVGASSVYAVGDVARWFSPRHQCHRRVEHWTSAVDQAACVGRHISRPTTTSPHVQIDYVWSDQYGVTVQVAGSTGSVYEQVWIGDRTGDGRLAILYSEAGRLAGAVSVNWPRAMLTCRRAIAEQTPTTEVSGSLTNPVSVPASQGRGSAQPDQAASASNIDRPDPDRPSDGTAYRSTQSTFSRAGKGRNQ